MDELLRQFDNLHPSRKGSQEYTPASVTMDLFYYLLGEQVAMSMSFQNSDVDRRTVAEALTGKKHTDRNGRLAR